VRVLEDWMKKREKGRMTYDFEELAFHLVFPAFGLHVFGYAENLIDCARDHPYCFFGLKDSLVG
jgi:hypothetical protein